MNKPQPNIGALVGVGRFEFQLWVAAIVKALPGRIGQVIRNRLMPYKNGRGVTVFENVQIDRPSRLTLGERVSINRGSTINAEGNVFIGDDVLIGPFVTIYSQNHRFSDSGVPINRQGYDRKQVVIGSNVWLASHVTVLPGVTIGPGTVVAAGAIVTKDLPPNVVAAGVPAVVIGKRIIE